MARDPEKRRFSREVDKTRKSTRRAIARLEKQAAETTNFLTKRQARAQIAELQKNLAALSAQGKNKTYLAHAQDALKTLQLNKVPTSRELKKQSIDFQAEMNKARRGEASILQGKGKERVQLFYKATQSIWQGAPMRERNKLIMETLGVSSMQAAFTKVMNRREVRAVWNQLNKTDDVVQDTDDMAQAYMQALRTQYVIDSPIEFSNLNIEWAKAYA